MLLHLTLTQNGDDVFMIAISRGYTQIVQTLFTASLASPDNNVSKNRAHVLLSIACSRGYVELVKFLLKSGVDPNFHDQVCN